MSGAILQLPTAPDADVGVVFIEVSGCLPMCGHGTIGTATVLVETGMVPIQEPVTVIRLDTPAGLVEASVEVENGRAKSVTLRNVPAYLHLRDAAIEVPGVGQLAVDLAWGGNFYALLPAASLGLAVRPSLHDDLIRAGLAIMAAINDQLSFVHPEHESIDYCHHVVLTEPGDEAVSGRAAVAIHPGWLDRPCGTGTSARMAQLHARGYWAWRRKYVHASVLGTRFTGRLIDTTKVGGFDAVIPTVRGRAWLTGLATYLLDPDDPFPPASFSGEKRDRCWVVRLGRWARCPRSVSLAAGRRGAGGRGRHHRGRRRRSLAAAGLDVCLLDRLWLRPWAPPRPARATCLSPTKCLGRIWPSPCGGWTCGTSWRKRRETPESESSSRPRAASWWLTMGGNLKRCPHHGRVAAPAGRAVVELVTADALHELNRPLLRI